MDHSTLLVCCGMVSFFRKCLCLLPLGYAMDLVFYYESRVKCLWLPLDNHLLGHGLKTRETIIAIKTHVNTAPILQFRHAKAGGNCQNINVLSGHKNAILDVKFTNDSEKIITASADYNLGVYDAMTGTRIKRFMGHKGIVNAVDVCIEG